MKQLLEDYFKTEVEDYLYEQDYDDFGNIALFTPSYTVTLKNGDIHTIALEDLLVFIYNNKK